MKRARSWFLALCLSVGLALCVARPAAAEQVLTIGLGPEIDTLDPHRSTTVIAGTLFVELWEGLTSFDAAANIVPGVAERWETSADGLTWTFHLRADARWSDGTPVTAEDFVFAWRRAVTPATRMALPEWVAPLRNAQAILEGRLPPEQLGVRAVDARTLEVGLDHPKPDFTTYTAYWVLSPLHRKSLEQHGDAFVQPGKLVGNGPFMLAEAVPQSHTTLVKNPRFRDAASVKLDRVVFAVTEDLQTELKRFRAGELDATKSIPPSQLDWVRENLPDAAHLAYQASTYYLVPNMTREPWKSNRDLRLALTLAIDREVITQKVTRGGEVPAWTMTPPGLLGYEPPRPEWAGWSQAQRDAKAKELLAKAGYGKGGKPLTVNILYNTNELNRQVMVAVAAMWQQKLGVKAEVENQEFKVTVSRYRERSWQDFIRTTWTVGLVSEYLNLLRGRSTRLGPGYQNPAFDAAMEAADRSVTLPEFFGNMAKAEAMAIADAASIPVMHIASRRLVGPRVRGWVDNPLDIHPLRYLSVAGP